MNIWKRRTLRWLLPVICVCIAIGGAVLWVNSARTKEAASVCEKNLQLIDGATHDWAEKLQKPPDAEPTMEDICPYTGASIPSNACPIVCPSGGTYVIGKVAEQGICSFHGFLIYVVDRSTGSNPIESGITGARVETFSSLGRRSESYTGNYGCAFVKMPSNKVATVTISKPGFITTSNSAQCLITNALVALERVPK